MKELTKNILQKVPNSVPFSSKEDQFEHERRRKIVFAVKNYKHKHCDAVNVKSKSIIQKLEKLSECDRSNMVKEMGGGFKQINFSGKANEYHSLLSDGLEQYSEDFFEIVCSGSNRVFGYFIQNIFYIVLIKDRHLEIKKK